MPEGPEVKTVARTLAHKLIGKRFGVLWHSNFQLRHPVDYEAIRQFEQRIISNVDCYGKLLFIDIDEKPALIAQLGMTGQLTVVPTNKDVAPHTHIRWPLVGTDEELRYVDPRRFGLFAPCDAEGRSARIRQLGPDPFLFNDHDADRIMQAIKKSSRSIKEIILDQSVVVGVGNIYASEALFLAGINPLASGTSISPVKIFELIKAIKIVLHQAYDNRGTTFSNYVDGSGERGKHVSFLAVFQRENEPCPRCRTPIARIKQAGRSSFFCPVCQK